MGAIGLGGALALSAAFYSRLFGRARLRFPYATGTIDPAAYRALAAKPGWSASSFEVAPGCRLNGLLRRPGSATAQWVLFYPGNDATMLETGQALLMRVAGDQDWGLAVYAYRGYDSSDGIPVLADLAADAPRILDGLSASEQVPIDRVHVVGFSIGGHLSTRAVAALAKSGRPPRTLSLLAPVDDIVMVRKSLWQRLDPGDDYQTRPLLADVPAPVLVVQGSADEALEGSKQGSAIAKALGPKATYVELAGVGHGALLENDGAAREVRTFVLAHAK